MAHFGSVSLLLRGLPSKLRLLDGSGLFTRFVSLTTIALWLSLNLAGQATPPPSDPVLQYLTRPRFYVVIAVNQIGGANADLPYAVVDAQQVKQTLESAGFKPLSESMPLVGNDATRPKVESLLRDIRDLPDEATVLVYYSGHAWTSNSTKEVWLQLYDNTVLGDQGLSFSGLLQLARGEGWQGEFAAVIDSCYSGKAAFGSELVGETAVLASSDQMEPSRPIDLPTGKISAFTHALLLASGTDFAKANTTRDGILTFDELTNFAKVELIDWNDRHLIDGPMNPRLFSNTTTIVFKYDPDKNQAPDSPLRKIITHKLVRGTLSQNDRAILAGLTISDDSLSRVRALLAKILPSFPDGQEKQAFAKLVSGNVREALSDLKQVNQQAGTTRDYDLDLVIARLYSAGGLDTEAADSYKTLLNRSSDPPNELKLAAASALTRAHQFYQAEALLTELIQSSSKKPPSQIEALAQNNLAVVYAATGKYKKAQTIYREALKDVPMEDLTTPWVATINSNLADAYRMDRKIQDAEKQYAYTVALQTEVGTDTTEQVSDLEKYSTVLVEAKKPDSAAVVKQRAETMKAEQLEVKFKAEQFKLETNQ